MRRLIPLLLALALLAGVHAQTEGAYKLLWSYETGGDVWDVSISSDGSYIAAGTSYPDYTIYLFDRSGNLLWSYETGGGVGSVSITPDGSYIAAGSRDNKIYFFDRSGKLLWSYETRADVLGVSIGSDGSYIAAGSDKVYLFASSDTIAKIAISSAKAVISSAKSSGYAVLQAEDLLRQAEEAFEAGEYSKAEELAKEAKAEAEQTQEAAREASEAIENARAAISSAPSVVGFIVLRLSHADSLLRQAEEAFAEGDYQTARKLALEAGERAGGRKYLATAYLLLLFALGTAAALVYALYRILHNLYLRWKRAREEYERAKAEVIRELEELIAMLEERSRRA